MRKSQLEKIKINRRLVAALWGGACVWPPTPITVIKTKKSLNRIRSPAELLLLPPAPHPHPHPHPLGAELQLALSDRVELLPSARPDTTQPEATHVSLTSWKQPIAVCLSAPWIHEKKAHSALCCLGWILFMILNQGTRFEDLLVNPQRFLTFISFNKKNQKQRV